MVIVQNNKKLKMEKELQNARKKEFWGIIRRWLWVQTWFNPEKDGS